MKREIPASVREKVKLFRSGERVPSRCYYGDVEPLWVGDVAYDAEEDCWVLRVREEDLEFSCGVECCGIEEYALVEIW